MFEVDVKNVTEEEGRRGPARVWGSDSCIFWIILNIGKFSLKL